jgi:hypothetical protein
MTSLPEVLVRELSESEIYDPRDEEKARSASRLADRLLALFGEGGEALPNLWEWEETLVSKEAPLKAHLAVKLARSKASLLSIQEPVHLSLVFAMYKEHTRILPPSRHPHGEDFLLQKIAQLEWLFEREGRHSWDLTAVDDGCPEGSGRLAQEILEARAPEAPVKVLFLEDAIGEGLEVVHPLRSAAESQKGGAVVYGMWAAATQERGERHVVGFTDADLSTNLGQAGLLIAGIYEEDRDAAIGSRREPTSVVIKQGKRNARGKLFIYLWKGLIPPLGAIIDTQCGFKAFRAETVRAITPEMLEKGFAFDVELLLKTELQRKGSICKVPIAWIDSEEASTTSDLQPYLSMLKAICKMYRNYLPPNPESDRLANWIEGLTEERWNHLAENVPPLIAEGDPVSFGLERKVPLEALDQASML